MIFRYHIIIWLIGAYLLNCVPTTFEQEVDDRRRHPGMVKINSSGRSFQQGWNDALASLDEKPGMVSSFTYDYWIDTTEITQKQYFEYTGRKPVHDTSKYGVGDNFPVYNVTWFDAVAFCNARSKAESLDTVYMYTGKRQRADGRIYELTSLRYEITRDGYRLPTEAEWEFAAKENNIIDSIQADSVAWYAANASNTSHYVAAKRPNTYGVYDLAGNVFEWTNDWKGFYNGKAIVNPLGAPQSNYENEKVIKGGAFNYSLAYLRPSNRSATYATMISAAVDYVGFRCARARISVGHYIGIEHTELIANPVMIAISRNDIQSFIGTPEVKLVLVNVTGNMRTLCYINFGRTFPAVVEYRDDQRVYMPVLSPDGKHVAYCSSNEGQVGPSKITIRSLDSLSSPLVRLSADSAYIPRWWVNHSTGDTCLIYTNSAVTNSSTLWRSSKTFIQKITGGLPVGEPQILVENGSFHDGRSINGRYLLTAYDRLMVRDAMTGDERQLFVFPGNGKDAGGSFQVCNASLSPDSGDSVRCLFLDFGSPGTSTITGDSYGIHEYLFMATMTGKVLGAIRRPDGEQSWDFTEWSNQSRFATGCGRNAQNQAQAVYALDLMGNRSMHFVSGTEIQQPSLWIGFLVPNPSNFALDSIGRYNEPLLISNQPFFATKLLMFWKYFDSLEVICTGSSVAIAGFDPSKITGLKSFNMGYIGGGLLSQKYFINSYILKHCSAAKLVCSSIDIGWFNERDGDKLWELGLSSSKGFKYDSANSFWEGGVTDDFRKIVNQIPLPIPGLDTAMGQYRRDPLGWGTNPPPFYGTLEWSFNDNNCQENLKTIQMISDTLRKKGIHWLMINFPISPHYKNDTAYSPWGPTRETAHEVLAAIKAMGSSNSYFHFYDANNDGEHDYFDEDANDENHLSVNGAAKLTTRLDSIIHTIIQ